MELEDFIPKTGSFHLSQTNKTYHLRKFNLADEAWLKTRFGTDAEISKVFTDVNIFAIAEIAFHQLIDDEREDFLEKSVTFIDDNGKKANHTIGGYKLLFALISGLKEKQDVIAALSETIGISRPMISKIELEQQRAKEEHFKKKINPSPSQSQLNGTESSTLSVANTAGR